MIVLTSKDGESFAVNPDLIERIFDRGQTQLLLLDGNRIMVTESLAEVIERIEAHRARVITLAQRIEAGPEDTNAPRAAVHLEVISTPGRKPRST